MKEELESLVSQMVDRGIRFEDAIGEFEKRFVKKALEAHKGNRSSDVISGIRWACPSLPIAFPTSCHRIVASSKKTSIA